MSDEEHCPRCGHQMYYDPTDDTMNCEYCGYFD